MIEPTSVLPVLGPIGFTLAVGVLLDRIVGPSPVPKPNETALQQGTSFQAALLKTYGVLFEDFFKGRLFSLSYLTRVGSVSIFLFVVILVFSNWQYFKNEYDLSNNLQLATIGACAFANVFIDAISLRITKSFMWFSINSKNLFNVIVAILSDLVFTVSAFKYLATAGLIVFYYASVGQFFGSKEVSAHEFAYIIQKSVIDENDVEYQLSFSVDGGVADHSGRPYSFLKVRMKEDDFLPFYKLNSALSFVDPVSLILIDNETNNEVIAVVRSVDGDRKSLDLKPLLKMLAEAPEGSFRVEIRSNYLIGPLHNLRDLTSAVLVQMNLVEASIFGGTFYGPRSITGAMRYNDLFGYGFGFTPYTNERICFSGVSLRRVSEISPESKCNLSGLAIFGVSNSPLYDLWRWRSEIYEVKLPVGVMLLTSLWFSLFLYVCFLGQLVLGIVRGAAFRGFPYLVHYVSKAPYSIGALLLGTLLSLVINFG